MDMELLAAQEAGANNGWDPLRMVPQVFSIVVVFAILMGVLVYYYFAIKKLKEDESPKGLALLLFMFIESFKRLTYDILGHKFIKITPYFIMLFSYIWLSNMISLVGLENPTTSTSVTVSMGLVTFVGTLVVGFRYQKLSYIKKFTFNVPIKTKKGKMKIPVLPNPLEMMGSVSQLISISFRLWGNIFAGALILTLLYAIPSVFFGRNPKVLDPGPEMLIFSIITPPFHFYFDLFAGSIQAFVFTLLTMVYWSLERGEGEEVEHEDALYEYIEYSDTCCVRLNKVSDV